MCKKETEAATTLFAQLLPTFDKERKKKGKLLSFFVCCFFCEKLIRVSINLKIHLSFFLFRDQIINLHFCQEQLFQKQVLLVIKEMRWFLVCWQNLKQTFNDLSLTRTCLCVTLCCLKRFAIFSAFQKQYNYQEPISSTIFPDNWI